MIKTLPLILFMFFATGAIGQVIGRVDKRTKEFYIHTDLAMPYRVFGYQLANAQSRKMICFSSRAQDVASNSSSCLLGAYFDTGKLNTGDKIVYLGRYGTFGKMKYISRKGKKTIFYLPKSSFRV